MAGVPLTPRERAVLTAVERRLTNSEIAAELFISVRTVESHIASLRRKLSVSSRRALIAAAGGLRETSIQIPANPLRGRGRDLAALTSMLTDGRTVTVVGVGGVGKTRLALEFARACTDRVPLVVELEHAEPSDVARRVARALGLEAAPGVDAVDGVAVALSSQPYLLVLDNADRVGEATAAALQRLRERRALTPTLITSRTQVGATDEVIFALSPLSTQGPDAAARELLEDRLLAAGRRLDEADLAVADRICARLDGLPLALELAASVARHLPLRELDTRLERATIRLERAAPAGRHRTLETAFEWTWDLLTPAEQDSLRRLAALPRTFDLGLAAAVTAPDASGVVLRLLDHSLIVPAGGEPLRFRLLAVMREFVHARTDPELIRDVLRRHAEYIAHEAAVFIANARTDASAEAAHASAMLCPEVNAALRWSLAARHPTALTLATTLAVGVEQYGADLDSINALAQAAVDESVVDRASAEDLNLLGDALTFVDVELVTALSRRALAIADDPDSLRAAHQLAGFAAAYRQETDVALDHLATAERLARELGQDWNLGAVRQARGIALRDAPGADPASALDAFASSIRAFARAGDRTHVNNVRYMMAAVAADDPDDAERARRWAAEARAEAEAMCNPHEAAHARLVQATLGLEEAGDLADLVDAFRQIGDLRCLNRALLLRASRCPTSRERTVILLEARGIAELSGDRSRMIDTSERLVAEYDREGDDSSALAALDRLRRVAGGSAATAACPARLLTSFAAEADPAASPAVHPAFT